MSLLTFHTKNNKPKSCLNEHINKKMALLSSGLLFFSLISLLSYSNCLLQNESSTNNTQNLINLLFICAFELILGINNVYTKFLKKNPRQNTIFEFDLLMIIMGISIIIYSFYKKNNLSLDFIIPINIITFFFSIYYIKSSFRYKKPIHMIKKKEKLVPVKNLDVNNKTKKMIKKSPKKMVRFNTNHSKVKSA